MNDNLISRNAAIDEAKRLHDVAWANWKETRISANTMIDALKDLPSAQPETHEKRTETHGVCLDVIDRQVAIDAICAVCGNDCDKSEFVYNAPQDEQVILCLEHYCLCTLPPAHPDIKQAAKLLSDFIESCPGGDSYLITPDGKELRTDWGYATKGIQLIHDWAERRTNA